MVLTQREAAERFGIEIELKFQLYNSLFLSLPFHGIEKTGALLSLFSQACEEGFEMGKDPVSIIDRFFDENTKESSDLEKLDLLFRFVQYAERQVVLFDALEDAAFARLHDLEGPGTLKQLEREVSKIEDRSNLNARAEDFRVRLILTAHPTQFYPGPVLAIINDLSNAIEGNDVQQVRLLLQQLGKTPFLKKKKPTPFDEAESLIWYLENVFYSAIGEISSAFSRAFDNDIPLVKMGFWSGGDRDGNPFVTKDITVRTARALRKAIFRCYHADIRKLRRRLTFEGVEEVLEALEENVYREAFGEEDSTGITAEDLSTSLDALAEVLLTEHNGLFAEMVSELRSKVAAFGTYFASLDIRQDSSVHSELFEKLARNTDMLGPNWHSADENAKITALLNLDRASDGLKFGNETLDDTIANLRAVRSIQGENGGNACHRYIISHSQSPLHVIEVLGLFALAGWDISALPIDIVPLFETVEDLKSAPDIMRKLYSIPEYRQHIARRGNTQTVMLGFSDGTKDGGYLMANYGIYRAKRELSEVSRDDGIEVVFFDGRGGPPARGGGKTHRFYASMGKEISGREIQLTIQGQTVSSNFGTVDAARYNIEQMIHAGLHGAVRMAGEDTFRDGQEEVLKELAYSSFRAYSDLKSKPEFLYYLERATPLNFYARTNIGSRPAKRGAADTKLSLDSLRAIPFVGAWSQIKQNVPGFFGVGTALDELSKADRLGEARRLYANNRFFKTLIDNCEMALEKTFLPLTSHIEEDPELGGIWNRIRDEYELTCRHIRNITGRGTLMDDFPITRQSVLMREKIVRPLAAIQQYALQKLRKGKGNAGAYEKLVMRCSFGIINAGRNSA